MKQFVYSSSLSLWSVEIKEGGTLLEQLVTRRPYPYSHCNHVELVARPVISSIEVRSAGGFAAVWFKKRDTFACPISKEILCRYPFAGSVIPMCGFQRRLYNWGDTETIGNKICHFQVLDGPLVPITVLWGVCFRQDYTVPTVTILCTSREAHSVANEFGRVSVP